MKKMGLLILILLLAACSSATETSTSENNEGAAEMQVVNSPTNQSTDSGEVRLNQDYDEALPVDVQLAIGTLQLEETEMAVDETMAADLLPLWQAVQSLTTSDTAAEVEITAVLNQIQSTMTPEQVRAIADMELTQAGIQNMLEAGTLVFNFGRGGFGGGSDAGGQTGGGFPGGPPGGGPGGGGPGGGGFPGSEQLDPSAVETRQAEFADGGDDPITRFLNRGMAGVVIRLLETKTGEVTTIGGAMTIVMDEIAQSTGLTVEEVQSQTVEGQSLAQIIEENGGEVTAVQANIVSALEGTGFGHSQDDLAQFVDNLLQGNRSGG